MAPNKSKRRRYVRPVQEVMEDTDEAEDVYITYERIDNPGEGRPDLRLHPDRLLEECLQLFDGWQLELVAEAAIRDNVQTPMCEVRIEKEEDNSTDNTNKKDDDDNKNTGEK